MKTAVYFGGTFDPIHQEHIRVCDLAYNEVRPDKLMLAPAPDGLCKRAAASAEQRLQMCRIAARDRPWLEVSDIEIKQNVRYSADALFHLLEQGEYSKIWFLLGEDQFSTLPQLSLIHISEPTRQAEISYAVFCLKKKKKTNIQQKEPTNNRQKNKVN